MSRELIVNAGLSFKKGHVKVSQSNIVIADVTGDDFVNDTQVIGTNDELLSFPNEIEAGGYLLIRNLDPDCYVLLKIAEDYYFAKLLPNDIALFRIVTKNIYAKAVGGTCRISKILIEE